MQNVLKLVIDNDVLDKYKEFYFKKYPKRRKFPFKNPIPPSLNQWIIMPRPQMNNVKQKWKEFGEFIVEYHGYQNMQIDKCDIVITYYFDSKRRHDSDNYTPKALFDSFTSSGMLIDDDFNHVQSLTIKGDYCKGNPSVVININY